MKLKARMGEFWWATVLLFVAYRFGDAINAAASIWLVPKFVAAQDLGAVLPLGNFAGFLVLPISVFTVAYTRKVAELGAKSKLGQLKTLISGAFVGSGLLLAISLLVSLFVLPAYLDRIRVGDGSLVVVILLSAFAGSLAPIFTAALQALKKFGTISLLQVVTAPARFLTMAAVMPRRPLVGYFAGQSAPPITSIVVSLWTLRRELAVRAEPFWRENGRDFLRFMAVLGAIYAVGSASGTFQSSLLRIRMSSVDSAAYYVITRFAEFSTYFGSAVAVVLFPIAAQAKARGEDATGTLEKANRITFLSGALVAAALYFGGERMLGMIDTCRPYAAYYPELAMVAMSMTMGMAVCNFANYEVAQNRFGYFLWEGPLSLTAVFVQYWLGTSSLYCFISVMLAQNTVGFAIVCAIIRKRRKTAAIAPRYDII